ncbi:DUF6481 family protein [Pseudoroseomonas wenyumeiae]
MAHHDNAPARNVKPQFARRRSFSEVKGYEPPKSDSFNDRLTAAAKAKEAMLERFRARPGPDDPALLQQQAERRAISDARDARNAARKVLREEEAARLVAEKADEAEKQKALLSQQAAEASCRQTCCRTAGAAEGGADARYAARQARRR